MGGTDSVCTPTLLESVQHVFIKKVAVNSGGKHCLALSSDGDVFSWGEGDDGKLGHDSKNSCDRPRVIEVIMMIMMMMIMMMMMIIMMMIMNMMMKIRKAITRTIFKLGGPDFAW